jgi:hypothetical protein
MPIEMNVSPIDEMGKKVHETLSYHFPFYHELLCFVLARCWSSIIEP